MPSNSTTAPGGGAAPSVGLSRSSRRSTTDWPAAVCTRSVPPWSVPSKSPLSVTPLPSSRPPALPTEPAFAPAPGSPPSYRAATKRPSPRAITCAAEALVREFALERVVTSALLGLEVLGAEAADGEQREERDPVMGRQDSLRSGAVYLPDRVQRSREPA